MSKRFIFSSESVGEGHPDKVADTISDALDTRLTQDKYSRVACETYVKSNVVVVGGEITTKASFDYVQIAREAIREIGYVNDDDVFHADKVFVNLLITQQSPTSPRASTPARRSGKKKAEQGAGDQGLMFGYACNETEELMPSRSCSRTGWDGSSPRSARLERPYRGCVRTPSRSLRRVRGRPAGGHFERGHLHPACRGRGPQLIEEFCIEEVIKKVLPKRLLTPKTQFLINRPAISSSADRRATPGRPDARSS